MAMTFMPLPDEFFEETEELGDAEFGRLVRWGLQYHLTGQTTALNGNERFYAKRLQMTIDRYHNHYDEVSSKRSAAGKASASKRGEQMLANDSKCQQMLTNANICIESKSKSKSKSKSNTIPSNEGDSNSARTRFTPPTVEEVRAYCSERGNSVDPEAFIDHYTANGWLIGGKSKMKDWKAAVRTWEKNGYNNNSTYPKATLTSGARDDSAALARMERLMEMM